MYRSTKLLDWHSGSHQIKCHQDFGYAGEWTILGCPDLKGFAFDDNVNH